MEGNYVKTIVLIERLITGCIFLVCAGGVILIALMALKVGIDGVVVGGAIGALSAIAGLFIKRPWDWTWFKKSKTEEEKHDPHSESQ